MAGFCLLAAGLRVRAQPPHGVAFYDADCLYDTVPSPFGNDTRYLPQGEMRWTGERYRRKVMQTAAVIDSLGLPLVGLYGVENESVVRDVAAACKGRLRLPVSHDRQLQRTGFRPVLLRRPLLPGQGGGGPFLDDGGGRTARSRARVSADERQRPLYRLQDRGAPPAASRRTAAGRGAHGGCRAAALRTVGTPCGGTPCRTGYAPCGESLGNAQQRVDRYGVPCSSRRCVRPPLAVRPVGRSAVGDLYPPAVWGGPGANLPVFCYFR